MTAGRASLAVGIVLRHTLLHDRPRLQDCVVKDIGARKAASASASPAEGSRMHAISIHLPTTPRRINVCASGEADNIFPTLCIWRLIPSDSCVFGAENI